MREADHNLPGIITAITPQKKNNDRYSIFVDDVFLMGVADGTLLHNNLKKGVEMTPSLFRRLQRSEGRHDVKSYILKLLSQRDHARRELYNKAIRKENYSAEVINDVLDELEGKGFINQKEFANKYARDKSHLNRWGPAKIKAHLLKKGVDKKISEQAVADTFEEINLYERFNKLLAKKRWWFLREKDTFKRKKKVFDYLKRKGYYPGMIYNHLESLMKILEP